MLAPAAETSAAVSVAFALAALLPAEAGFSLAVPVPAVLSEPPLDGVVLSDGAGLEVTDVVGAGEVVVVLGLVVLGVGVGVGGTIGAPDDADGGVNTTAGWLHDAEGLGLLAVEERDGGDAEPSVVPRPPGRPLVWEPLPPGAPGATPLVGEMVDDTLWSAT